MTVTHKGACFCGAVTLEATGEPVAMGFCHCESCRSWSAAPVNAFTLWQPGSVVVTQGEDNIGTYNKTPNSYRKFCKTCGGHIMTAHPPFDLMDVYAATIPSLAFKPALHVFYSERVLPMADGLPKLKDFPEPFGGTGEMMAE
jgi:hypothetical protein